MTRRWLWLLLLLPIVLGLLRLRFDVEVLDLLPPNLPAVQGLKLYQQHFANARELLITIKAADPEQGEAASRTIAERLRQQTNLVADALWEPPWLEHPGQSAELLAYLWLNQTPGVFAELEHRLAPEKLAGALAETRESLATSMSPAEIARSSYDPYGFTRLPESATGAAPAFGQGQELFASPDGAFRVLFVEANRDLTTYRDCANWLKEIRAQVDEAMRGFKAVGSEDSSSANASVNNQPFTLGYTGRPAFVAEIATGMERDITISVGGTSVIIAMLFWLAHRRLKPMLWLLTLLALILGCTLALGGLVFGAISVISMGFAAILLGLAVDYAVVHYQEALAHQTLTVPQIRRAIAPSIFWAAVTSISAFLVLNFGGLPGLAQLGSLVGIGIALSACVMIFAFLPPLFPDRMNPDFGTAKATDSPASQRADGQTEIPPLPRGEGRGEGPVAPANRSRSAKLVFSATAVVLLLSIGILLSGLPRLDPTANALHPRNSPSYAALEDLKKHLNQNREPLWLLVSGRTETDVTRRLEEVKPTLTRAVSNNLIADFKLPTPLWPRPEFQAVNRATAQTLVGRRALFRAAAQTNGFAASALGLTEEILNDWQHAAAIPGVFWPTNAMSQWIFSKVIARSPTNFFALGFINPSTNVIAAPSSALAKLESQLPQDGVLLSGWELLGTAIFSSVKQNMWKLILPMISLVLISLWLAFRRPQEILLSLAVLTLSGLCLLSAMRLAGWSWNLLNLMALPLILGTGVDYSIFMQLALRRYQGDLNMAYRSVGRALLLCGATAIAGFGSLAWSSNAGMASLGVVCAIGIAGNMLISVLLLPIWWQSMQSSSPPSIGSAKEGASSSVSISATETAPSSNTPHSDTPHALPTRPSVLYCSLFWRFGLRVVRLLPEGSCARISKTLAHWYSRLAARRREVVVQNLLPVLKDPAAVEQSTQKLFEQFALKLVDLWRFEAGLPIDQMFGEYTGWQHFLDAKAQKRGILLVTAHLGNWEFGAPALGTQGVRVHVVTLAEPGRNFTRLRLQSRARRDIETIVIGQDPFVFVDIIRRLEGGACVALLVDRPSSTTSVTVELFGRPFAASIAAAELARASGCIVLPVYMLRTARGYSGNVLPPVPYDRAGLRDRDARQQLTQHIMRAFEPVIRQHPDQWFHFVPMWTSNGKPQTPNSKPS